MKGDVCYVVVERLAMLLPVVTWKIDEEPNKLMDPAKGIANQMSKVLPSFFKLLVIRYR